MTDWLKEIALGLYYPIAGIINNIKKLHEDSEMDAHNPTLPTVVFVKRWFNHNPLHIQRKQYLQDKGFNVYYYFQSISKGTWEKSAENLDQYIKDRGLENVTLVGISGGGITAYLYLQNLNGWKYVDTFISIATPFGGTWQELFLSFNESCRQLTPNSQFVQNIMNQPVKNPEKIYCIRAESDELVENKSAVLPGCKEIVIPVKGHNNLHLFDNTVYDKIAEIAHNEDSD